MYVGGERKTPNKFWGDRQGDFLELYTYRTWGLSSTSVGYQVIVEYQQIPRLAWIDFICLTPNIIQETLFQAAVTARDFLMPSFRGAGEDISCK